MIGKSVSSTDRLSRRGETERYTYNYKENIPYDIEIFDGIVLPSKNTRTGFVGVTYWITKEYVNSLFEKGNKYNYTNNSILENPNNWIMGNYFIRKLLNNKLYLNLLNLVTNERGGMKGTGI